MSIQEKYFRTLEDFYASNLLTMRSKNEDYASVHDPFENFRFAANAAGVTVEQVFLVLLGVKLARLRTLVLSDKEPNNESIGDTLGDSANYNAIMASYEEFKNSFDEEYTWAQSNPGEEYLDGDPGDEQPEETVTLPAVDRLREMFGFKKQS